MNILKSPLCRRCEAKLEELQLIRENPMSYPKIDGKEQRKTHHIDIQINLIRELLKK
jgi:hypothetical protein